jgi:amidase
MDVFRLTAHEAVRQLKRGEVSPLELVDAAIARIEATNGAVNAIVTTCYERAREHARRLMREPRENRPAN